MPAKKIVRCSGSMYATTIGATPKPQPLWVDVGPERGVPSVEAKGILEEALKAGAHAATQGLVAEIRIIFVPDDVQRGARG